MGNMQITAGTWLAASVVWPGDEAHCWAHGVIQAGEESAAIRPTGAPMGASGDAAIRRVMSAPHSAHLLSSVSRTAPTNTPGTSNEMAS